MRYACVWRGLAQIKRSETQRSVSLSEYQLFVVGQMTVDGQRKPSEYPSLDTANEVLAAAGLPIRLQTIGWDANEKGPHHNLVPEATAMDMSVGANIAEGMLLDWISDEIGEPLFGSLYSLDAGMTHLQEMVGSTKLVRGKGAKVWQALTEARRDLARHLKWLDDAATRRGRPALSDEAKTELFAE